MTAALTAALISELVEALEPYGLLRCAPMVTMEDEVVLLQVRIEPERQENTQLSGFLATLGLFHALQRVCDVAQLRALCARYDINAAALETLLPKEE